MSYTLAESLWLARSGFEDVLLAYPSADRAAFGELAHDAKLAAAVTVMVDDPAQLDLIERSRDGGAEEIRVCLELDTALHLLGGRVRVGARRSPLREPGQLADLARTVHERPGFRVVGLMAYEGHIAGVGDSLAGRPLRSRMIRMMQGAARGNWPRGGPRWCGRCARWCRTWSSSTAAVPAASRIRPPRTR